MSCNPNNAPCSAQGCHASDTLSPLLSSGLCLSSLFLPFSSCSHPFPPSSAHSLFPLPPSRSWSWNFCRLLQPPGLARLISSSTLCSLLGIQRWSQIKRKTEELGGEPRQQTTNSSGKQLPLNSSEWKSLANIINSFPSVLLTGVLQQASSCLEFSSVLRRHIAHMKPWMRKSLVTCEVSYQCALAATPTSPMLLRACSLTITKTSSPVSHFLRQRNSSLEA